MRLSAVLCVCLLANLVVNVWGDCYMHFPPGSNNRLNSKGTNTQNNNRLFDSQNNNNGGYNNPKTSPGCCWYSQSLLQVEWTVQHGCGQQGSNGKGKVNCNMVLQYACGDSDPAALDDLVSTHIRNGARDESAPALGNNALETRKNANPDELVDGTNLFLYGQHESKYYYDACKTRERNKGLYHAGRNVQNNRGATATRQNNNGNQRGFECPEERDYYPYWHPTPWVDIAVFLDPGLGLTKYNKLCGFMTGNSQNVREKHYCRNPDGSHSQYNNEADCINPNNGGHVWVAQAPWGVGKPECVEVDFVRVNHLGNAANGRAGFASSYDWVLPSVSKGNAPKFTQCVLRIRYNISTGDYDGWEGFAYGSKDKAVTADSPTQISNNPTVMFGQRNYTLAVNTAQFGRTFQDRSHKFCIRPRSGIGSSRRIYNLGVKGKRGNIVQAYPATEYDYHPNSLELYVGDYIHFCWEGSSENNGNYAGEGTSSTDRHNLCPMKDLSKSMPVYLSRDDTVTTNEAIDVQSMFKDQDVAQALCSGGQPAYCAADFDITNDDPDPPCCLTYDQLQRKHGNNNGNKNQDRLNCNKLNLAPEHFEIAPVSASNMAMGENHFVGTRNNNFSNRSQKGTIVVRPHLSWAAVAFVIIGVAFFVGGAVVAFGLYYSQSHPGSTCANIFQNLS